eukprot:gnl/MRDRNA2_/MRDRNA2_80786_c0_seq1.p1 gnl/MRDRNA2_/MRDRNA2_80786_c0~~gnl/MRDRNA2_/MRDRNA2_80786_c0_seq1.p1  ORF type:complete len:119 (+),score=2.03 gnl/MRDRNA2_/MRDRNA2_80786_c0_seq1:321-677(+)
MKADKNITIIGKELYDTFFASDDICDKNRMKLCIRCIKHLWKCNDRSYKRRCLIEYMKTLEGTEKIRRDLSCINLSGWVCADMEIERGRYGVDLNPEEEEEWDTINGHGSNFECVFGF